MPDFDIAIVGAGIAGASLASELAPHRSVVLLEMEGQPGYHSTGRSAAFWTESYGGPLVQPLTTASGPFLRDPPRAISERGFLKRRGALTLAEPGDIAKLDAFERAFAGSNIAFERLDSDRIAGIVPVLARGDLSGVYEPDCCDIDVSALHQACLGHARRYGAEVKVRAELVSARRTGSGWAIETAGGAVRAAVIVNAAGAWADEVARRAGARPLGIQPMRRTIVQLRVDPPAPDDLPLVLGVDGDYYFKPDAGRIWLSPHDETPCEPGDVAAEEIDVALAIDRFLSVTGWRIEAVERRWAGLRNFAPDRLPVYGFAPETPGFYWCAGQGGWGIQTAPAAAMRATAQILDMPPDPVVADIDMRRFAPDRFG